MGVAQKWTQRGTIAPLFDRLCDYEPMISHEPVPLITYTKKQMIASIEWEVENLLNTRCGISMGDYETLDPKTLPYGVPDLFGLPDGSFADGASAEGVTRLAEMLTNSIRIFEPRLRNVHVAVQIMDPKTQSAQVSITAGLVIGDVQETISFPVSVHNFRDLADREEEDYDTTAKLEMTGSEQTKDSAS